MTDHTTVRFALVTFALGLSACAAELDDPELAPDAAPVVRPDASEQQTVTPDAPAPVDAAVVVPDAVACVPQVTQLLINPAFDTAPGGTGWQQRLAVANSPVITATHGCPTLQ